jgi:hypothetical protein
VPDSQSKLRKNGKGGQKKRKTHKRTRICTRIDKHTRNTNTNKDTFTQEIYAHHNHSRRSGDHQC